MPRRRCTGFLVALLLGLPSAAGAVPRFPLEREYEALTLDGPLDAAKVERLRLKALEDDLVLDRAEAEILDELARRGDVDPSRALEPTFEGQPPTGWVRRAQDLLVRLLRAGLGSPAAPATLRELHALALRGDLSPLDRMQIGTLIDHFRAVDPRRRTRDLMEALAVVVTDPEGALRDREHRRQLEALSILMNRPLIPVLPATASPR